MTSSRACVTPTSTTNAESYAGSPVHPSPATSKTTSREDIPSEPFQAAGLLYASLSSCAAESGPCDPNIEMPFRFLDLPPEIRNMIYRTYIEVEFEPLDGQKTYGFKRVGWAGSARALLTDTELPLLSVPGIMVTCKLLSMEYQPFHYAIPRDFGHNGGQQFPTSSPIDDWVAKASPHYLRYMTKACFSQEYRYGPCHVPNCVKITLTADHFPKGSITLNSGFTYSFRSLLDHDLEKFDTHLKFESKRVWKDETFCEMYCDEYGDHWDFEGIYHVENMVIAAQGIMKLLKTFHKL